MMDHQPDYRITVLYVCIDSSMGGSTQSLYGLIESVKDSVSPIVLFPGRGVGYDFFIKQGITCYVHPFVTLYRFNANRLIDVWKRPWRWHRIKKLRIDLGCAFYMKRRLKRRKIDIVHTNTSPNNVGVYLARLFGAKHVWHIRECLDAHAGLEIYGGMSKLKKQINQADARIAISSYVKRHWDLDDRNTFLIHDAICSKEDVVIPAPKEKYVLFISYYVTEAKGARKAIKAFGLSRLSDDGYRLALMGNCDRQYQESLLDTAKEFHCDRALEFIPCQSNVKPFFEKASALIQASEFEGLGLVVEEAMFYGCPVVAHASGGTMDLINDGVTGFLYSSLDECAGLLRKVCLSSQDRIIHQAQDFAIHNLSIEEYGSKILEVYDTVLG